MMGPIGLGQVHAAQHPRLPGPADRGVYRLDGVEVDRSLDEDEVSAIRRHKIGFVFQTFHLVPRLDAAENVAFPMVFAGVPRTERRERVARHSTPWDSRREPATAPESSRGVSSSGWPSRAPWSCGRGAAGRRAHREPRQRLRETGHGPARGAECRGLTLIVVTHDPNVARARTGAWSCATVASWSA